MNQTLRASACRIEAKLKSFTSGVHKHPVSHLLAQSPMLMVFDFILVMLSDQLPTPCPSC